MGTLSPLVTTRIHALRAVKIAARDDLSRCDLCLRIAVESRTCVPGECPLSSAISYALIRIWTIAMFLPSAASCFSVRPRFRS